MVRSLPLLVAVLALCLPLMAMAKDLSLISESFEQDPAASGWAFSPANAQSPGKWLAGEAHSGTHFITAKEGKWEGPKFAVTPFQYYKLTFYSKADPAPYGHYYCLFFQNSKGEELVADHYGSFDPSTTWQKNEFFIRAKAGSATAQVRFQPLAGGNISIDDVRVEPATPQQVLAWEDALYKTLPPLKYTAPKSRFQYIPKTIKKLAQGGTVRIVMLGDSIINDTGSSPMDLMINRHYPKAKVEVITSVGGGKGTWYFREENRVQSHIVDLKPDLLIIGGISGTKPDDNEECIKQMRAAGCNPEIMLMTGPITPRVSEGGKPWEIVVQPEDHPLAKEAMENKYEFMDIRGPFSQYESYAGKTPEYFRRDPVHANDRSRAILAKIIETWWTPKGK